MVLSKFVFLQSQAGVDKTLLTGGQKLLPLCLFELPHSFYAPPPHHYTQVAELQGWAVTLSPFQVLLSIAQLQCNREHLCQGLLGAFLFG